MRGAEGVVLALAAARKTGDAAEVAQSAHRLAAAGFSTRSGFLTSPTVGGGSWLAYASLLSGTWVDNQRRYEALGASDRLRLTGAFQRAGWHTVALMPGVTELWPEPARTDRDARP